MNIKKVKIHTTVPTEYAEKLRQALGEAGAGNIGEYSFCSFNMKGTGKFKPSENANPHIGQAGKLETVEEDRIEVVCERGNAKKVVEALRNAHPYEEPIVDIYPLIEVSDL